MNPPEYFGERLVNTRQKDLLLHEAIARITWGESPASVRAWLSDSGIRPAKAASFVRKCVRRRAREMRGLGSRNFMRGLFFLVAAVVAAIAAWPIIELMRPPIIVSGIFSKGFAAFAGMMLLPAFGFAARGVWQLWLAHDRLLFGSRADGPVTDIEDFPL